ncbi:fibronectin type III domain-containing protein 5 isoform X3 [Pelodiscus sinensis]|uniref:fibronectin type III domain-containing protein 5 isoform X3 n=1 Tax=Pelodiscus sinensis TaxID=13735 RepID=UPI003F6D3319
MNGAGGRGTSPRCGSGRRRVAAPWSSAPPLFPPRSPAASPEPRARHGRRSRAGELPAVLRCPRRAPAAEPGPEPAAARCGMAPRRRTGRCFVPLGAALLVYCSCAGLFLVEADSPSAPVNVTVKHLKANSAVVTWDVLEDEVVIGFAISQQKKDVRMLRFIQEVNTTTRSCALWDLEEDTEYIVHVQSISIQGQSPASEPVLFKTPREAEKLASKNKDEVTMKEMGKNQQLRAGEILIIVVVLFMWAGVIALFCRQYDIIKDNEPNNNKEKAKSPSESSTPEHQGGGLLRSKS